jgi:hypothetical protein
MNTEYDYILVTKPKRRKTKEKPKARRSGLIGVLTGRRRRRGLGQICSAAEAVKTSMPYCLNLQRLLVLSCELHF